MQIIKPVCLLLKKPAGDQVIVIFKINIWLVKMTKLLRNGFFSKKKFSLFLIISLFLFSGYTFSQEGEKIYHPLSGTVVFSLDYTTTIGWTDYNSNVLNVAWRGSGEYFLPLYTNFFAGFRLYGGSGYVAGKRVVYSPPEFKTSILYGGAGLEAGYRVEPNFYPYVMIGLNYLYFHPKDANGNALKNFARFYTTHTALPSIEIGGRFFLNDNVAIDASYTHHFFPNDYLDDLSAGTSKDAYSFVNVGVSYALFEKKDSDNDGVNDDVDQCPNTPAGVKVDEFGCPLDADNDGVPDYLDKCPFTPAGVKVDKDGCPLDSDLDGVPDYLDHCPGTPTDVKVNNNGCPLDSDGDGVPDYLDHCANTPPGTEVDNNGCPKVKVTPEKKPEVIQPQYDNSADIMVKRNIWSDGKLFVIQVASFRNKNSAYNLMQKWQDKGYNTFVVSKYIRIYRATYYRVRIGYYNTLREAQIVYKKLGVK